MRKLCRRIKAWLRFRRANKYGRALAKKPFALSAEQAACKRVVVEELDRAKVCAYEFAGPMMGAEDIFLLGRGANHAPGDFASVMILVFVPLRRVLHVPLWNMQHGPDEQFRRDVRRQCESLLPKRASSGESALFAAIPYMTADQARVEFTDKGELREVFIGR